LLQGEEVDVVCGIYGLGCTEDGVGDGVAAAEEGGVFDVVDAVAGGRVSTLLPEVAIVSIGGGITHSKLAVWSIPTTLVIMDRLESGTFNQTLNAAINCDLMSFPGCPYR
jgi:hypothetical protein